MRKKQTYFLLRKKLYVLNFELQYFTGVWDDDFQYTELKGSYAKTDEIPYCYKIKLRTFKTTFLPDLVWDANVTGLLHPLWKAADITTPMQCYKSSPTMLWLCFGLLSFLFQHRKQGFLKTLCYIMVVITVFSYLVVGLCLRIWENSEIKCSSGRSCCLFWK